jgi:hypothetical protein
MDKGLPAAVSFRIKTDFGLLTFPLPRQMSTALAAVLQRSRRFLCAEKPREY